MTKQDTTSIEEPTGQTAAQGYRNDLRAELRDKVKEYCK